MERKTKADRAITASDKEAQKYVEDYSSVLKNLYYLSNSQIDMVKRAFKEGFLAGAKFK